MVMAVMIRPAASDSLLLQSPSIAASLQEASRQMALLVSDDGPGPQSPEAAVQFLSTAYNARWLGGYIGCLTPDFRFVSSDPEMRAQYPRGFDRWDEFISARNMFYGGKNHAGQGLPPARDIHLDLGSPISLPDHADPDSIEWYRTVIVPSYHLVVTLESGEHIDASTGWQEFQLVRVRVSSERDAARWMIRRWVQHEGRLPDSILSGRPATAPTSAAPESLDAAPGKLAFARFTNPMRIPLSFLCSVPDGPHAEFDLLDIAGRRLIRREIGKHRGLQRVDFDWARLEPGVYWMRLRQGASTTKAKIVLIR